MTFSVRLRRPSCGNLFHVPRRPPSCPTCSSTSVRPIVYGEPDAELVERARRHEVVLAGCLLTDDDPAWDCPECGHRFGDREKPYKNQAARSGEEWVELIKTMLPAPVRTNDAGELLGGDPVLVIVRVEATAIEILEASIVWEGAHSPALKGRPFAKVPLRTPAARVAELIGAAWAKRISRYRWCPRCRRRNEPEHMQEAICHGCAERFLGVVF